MNDQQTTVAQGVGETAHSSARVWVTPSVAIAPAHADRRGSGWSDRSWHRQPVADRKAQYARQEDFLVAEIRRNEESHP